MRVITVESGAVLGCLGATRSQAALREPEDAESLPTAQDPQAGVREPRGHHRDLHDGCKRCKSKHKGCRRAVRLLAWVGGPSHPGPLGLLGRAGAAASVSTQHPPPPTSRSDFRRWGWGGAGKRLRRKLFSALSPIYRPRVALGAWLSSCIPVPRAPRLLGRRGEVPPLQGPFQRGLACPGHPHRAAGG